MSKPSYGRKDRLRKEKIHDSYLKILKLPESTVCKNCGSVYSNGRWTWKKIPNAELKTTCPACKRCADNYPAGSIQLSGIFFQDHKEEILNLVQNIENQEKNERPLERIMEIKKNDTSARITTTGIHIARRIGEALARAYKGDYSFQYANGAEFINIKWSR